MPFIGYNWSNASNLARGLGDAPNANTGGNFWLAILWMMWIIALGLTASFGWEIALMSASFGALVIGTFMVYFDVLAWQWLIAFAGIDLFMFFYVMWSSRN